MASKKPTEKNEKKLNSSRENNEFFIPLGQKNVLTYLPSPSSTLMPEDPFKVFRSTPNEYFPDLSATKKEYSEYPEILEGVTYLERLPYLFKPMGGLIEYDTLHDMFVDFLRQAIIESHSFLLEQSYEVMVSGIKSLVFTDVLPYNSSLLSAADRLVRPVAPTIPIAAVGAAVGLVKTWTIAGFGREVYNAGVINYFAIRHSSFVAGDNINGNIPIKAVKDGYVSNITHLLYGFGYHVNAALNLAPVAVVPLQAIFNQAAFVAIPAGMNPINRHLLTDIFLSCVGGSKPTTSLVVSPKNDFLSTNPTIAPRDINALGNSPISQAEAQTFLDTAFNAGLASVLGMFLEVQTTFDWLEPLNFRELIGLVVAIAVLPPNTLSQSMFTNLFQIICAKLDPFQAVPQLVYGLVAGNVNRTMPALLVGGVGLAVQLQLWNSLIACAYSRTNAVLPPLAVTFHNLNNGPTTAAGTYARTWQGANVAISGGTLLGTDHPDLGIGLPGGANVSATSEQIAALMVFLATIPRYLNNAAALRKPAVVSFVTSLIGATSLGMLQIKNTIDVAIRERLSYLPYQVFPVNVRYPYSLPVGGISLMVSDIEIPLRMKDKSNVLANVSLALHFRNYYIACALTHARIGQIDFETGEVWERVALNLSSSKLAAYIASVASKLQGSENYFGLALMRLVGRSTYVQANVTYADIINYIAHFSPAFYCNTTFEDWATANAFCRLYFANYAGANARVLGLETIHNTVAPALPAARVGLNAPIAAGSHFNIFVSASFSSGVPMFSRQSLIPGTIVTKAELMSFLKQKCPNNLRFIDDDGLVIGGKDAEKVDKVSDKIADSTFMMIGTLAYYTDVPAVAALNLARATAFTALAYPSFSYSYQFPTAGNIVALSITNKGISRVKDFTSFELLDPPSVFV